MLTSAADPTISGHTRREDDVALLARFVQCLLPVNSHLSVTDWSQMHSRTALRSCGKTRRQGSRSCGKTKRRGYLSAFTPDPLGGGH